MKGWRTYAFNFAMLALASPEVLALIPPRWAIYISVVGNLILRSITNTPVGRSE